MKLWRIANARYIELSGDGGLFYSARWNRKGTRMVYSGDHPALSVLEVIVHLDIAAEFLPDYALMEIDVPDDIAVTKIDETITDEGISQAVGSQWVAEGRSALLRVRSVLVPESFNYLINPLHDDADRIAIVETHPFNFDPRLLRLVGITPEDLDGT